ncbi:MAG: V-type ATP synthase subunit D [Oscillospiraceae bacterium]|nr:V-type ATP synthase subunit D [Oscillospiraceae bacterium]
MAEQVFPTKGNLINIKKSLALSQLGYELLDRKRNILIRELLSLVDDAKELRGSISEAYSEAYKALQKANISLGIVERVAQAVPIENSVKVSYRSVMGVELVKVHVDKKPLKINYGLNNTNGDLDYAYYCFDKVKHLTTVLAEVENNIYRLATAVKKTQSRANALKNIVIPKFQANAKYISDSLEEKEREEFSRMKVIKLHKNKSADDSIS